MHLADKSRRTADALKYANRERSHQGAVDVVLLVCDPSVSMPAAGDYLGLVQGGSAKVDAATFSSRISSMSRPVLPGRLFFAQPSGAGAPLSQGRQLRYGALQTSAWSVSNFA